MFQWHADVIEKEKEKKERADEMRQAYKVKYKLVWLSQETMGS